MASKPEEKEHPTFAVAHILTGKPYRMVVYDHTNHHEVHLYRVAGLASAPMKAKKALKEAASLHETACFYCQEPLSSDQITIDHAIPVAKGGGEELANLLVACKPCNSAKGSQTLESFKPDAGREWLSALLANVEERLRRL